MPTAPIVAPSASSSSLALPDRFRDATFDTYEAGTAGQAAALHAAQQFVAENRRPPSRVASWTASLKHLLGIDTTSIPKGLYLVGPAGTGKTHLLAAAYNALTPEVPCAFLHSSTLFRQTEPPQAVADQLADRAAVCCLDEVEIDDPANEMRLAGMMNALTDRGVPLLATSNVEPGEHLSRQFSGGRFQRFLRTEFRGQYQIVSVGGADYRRTQSVQQSGAGWIGPHAPTRRAMQHAQADASGTTRWWSFAELRRATTETAHPALIDDLTGLDHLFVENIAIETTDDAFRLLRVVDALYLHAEAPALYFTARRPPDGWFAPDRHRGVAQAVAEKFSRTVSRLHALCALQHVDRHAPTNP